MVKFTCDTLITPTILFVKKSFLQTSITETVKEVLTLRNEDHIISVEKCIGEASKNKEETVKS